MEPDPPRPNRDVDAGAPQRGHGATSEGVVPPGAEPVDPGPEHDPTTSREAFEREMAEQGRSDEAQNVGDHIE